MTGRARLDLGGPARIYDGQSDLGGLDCGWEGQAGSGRASLNQGGPAWVWDDQPMSGRASQDLGGSVWRTRQEVSHTLLCLQISLRVKA